MNNYKEKTIVLNTGAQMPIIGIGMWNVNPAQVEGALRAAINQGYRHIDGAWVYGNEKEIGAVLKQIFNENQIKREDLFITTKLWNSFHAKDEVEKACKESLLNLGLDYVDLYLMHWGVAIPQGLGKDPLDKNGRLITAKVPLRDTWEAMEDLVHKGLVKAIGVSNFTYPMINDLLSYAKVPPAMNQVELHPYNAQTLLVDYCHSVGIAVTAYSLLGSPGTLQAGEPRLLDDPIVTAIAQTYGKSAAQVLLRWAIQRQTVAIPKSVHPDKIKSNFDVFDFELSGNDMQQLTNLDRHFRYSPATWWGVPYFD